MRVGIIAKKVGMTSIYDENAKMVPVTVLKYEPNVVSAVRTVEKEGYSSVQVAAFDAKTKNVTKPLKGHFAKAGVTPKHVVKEFRVDSNKLIDLGAEISIDHFVIGQFIDIQGVTQGKGFAGVMKRWNFKGTEF
jgi:large subunit ribosomal protein L3